MNQRAWVRRFLAGIISCCLLLVPLLSAMAAPKYPYETMCFENVNMRKSARGSAVIVKKLSAGETVKILGATGSYYKLEAQGETGYALKLYVDGLSSGAETPPLLTGYEQLPSSISKYPYDTTVLASVKFRKTASDTAEIMSRIPRDATVRVQGLESNGYAKVRYSGKTGFVHSGFLILANIPAPTPVPTPTINPNAEKYATLEDGSVGADVRALQEALTELTFYSGTVDAKYGGQTKTAVNAFKKRNGMTEDGIADGEMQLLLYEGKPKNSKGYRKDVKTLAPVGDVAIASGNRGEPVERLQVRLKELGYFLGETTGVCDKDTVAAIKEFQHKHFLKKTGVADAETQSLLYGATAFSVNMTLLPTPAPTAVPATGTVRKGDTSNDAKAVQQRLQELGYFKGKVDGKFTRTSENALIEFQKANGLKADGVAGEQTRNLLWPPAPPVFEQVPESIAATALQALTPETAMVIMPGSRGNAVKNLQIRLSELGYYSSRMDGVYLEDDISAVRVFQQRNGLTVTGNADYPLQALLFSDNAIPRGLGALGENLRYGSEGAEVADLQLRLTELGFFDGSADGKFGLKTKTAVMAFQKANQLVRDGVIGDKTYSLLYDDSATAKTKEIPTTQTLREGSVSSAVTNLQNRLIALGYLTGKADGKFGIKTSLALIEFQKKNNLLADGVAGKKTLEALNKATIKPAEDTPAVKPAALQLNGTPPAASVRYENWYTEIRNRVRQYPNVTIYDFMTGISWQVNLFSFGAHADGEPITANDTATMNRAFGGKTTWTPKPVWVILSDGTVYMASTHNTPHETSHSRTNDFAGHLCVHFPRTMAQVEAIGPYATSHQKTIDLGWQATLALMNR